MHDKARVGKCAAGLLAIACVWSGFANGEKMCGVYIFDEMATFTEADFAAACGVVSASRREKMLSYACAIDREQSAIAELLLRHALRDKCSLARLPEIWYGCHGKPMLKGADMPYFNISHCKLAVACVVSDACVGVDVEPYSSYSEEVAREVFCDEELAYAIGSPERFAELWTKKESYLKYTGEGLSDSLPSVLSEAVGLQFDTFHSAKGYACTVCAPVVGCREPIFVNKKVLFDG